MSENQGIVKCSACKGDKVEYLGLLGDNHTYECKECHETFEGPSPRKAEMSGVLADYKKRKEREDRLKKRQMGLKNSSAYYVDLADDCIRRLPALNWPDVQAFQPKAGALEDWQAFTEIADEPLIKIFRQAGNAKITGIPAMPMKALLSEHISKLVAIEGKVIGLGDIEPTPLVARFRCLDCQHVSESRDGRRIWKCFNEDCGKRNLELDQDASVFADSQVIRIQELGNEKGRQLTLACVAIDEEFLWAVRPGQKVKVTGVFKVEAYREQKSYGKMKFLKRIEIANIESLDAKVEVTPADIERFKEMAKDPLHYQILVESFAPHLYGLDEQKELCIMILASSGITRPFNGALCGPPAHGKTELLKFAVALSPNGHYATVAQATTAGLTSASVIDPDTQTRLNKPGLFSYASPDGLVALTELQSIKPPEAKSLNDALESKVVASARAEGAEVLEARCSVLIDTNNFAGDWDYELRLAYNLKFMERNIGAFLSRLDLISIVPRMKDKETFKNMAYSNFDTYSKNQDVIEQFMEDYEVNGIPHYGVRTLRKYFAYVLSLPLPPVDKNLRDDFADNFVEAMENNKDYLVDGRYNRSVLTAAMVRARLLLKDKTDDQDQEEAIRIVNKAKNVVVTVPGKQATDGNAYFGIPPTEEVEKAENKMQQFIKAFEQSCKDKEGNEREWATKEDIMGFLWTKKWDEDEASAFVEKMRQKGWLYEPQKPGQLFRNPSFK